MGAVTALNEDVRTARRNAMQRESERLDNDAGRAFRLYLAARHEGRSAADIAALKAAYEAAAKNCRSVRTSANGETYRSVVAA